MNGQTFLCFFRAYPEGFQKTLYRVNVGDTDSKVLSAKGQAETVSSIKQYIVDTITANKLKPITTFNTETATTLQGLLTVLLTAAGDAPNKNTIKISLIDRDLGDGLVPAIKVATTHQGIKSVTYYPIEEPAG